MRGVGLLLVACLSPAIASARPFDLEGAERRVHGYVEVDREIELVLGDDPAFAQPGTIQGSGQAVVHRGTMMLPAPSSIGWFRVELDVSPEMAARGMHLLLFSIGAAELYVDGRLSQTYGDIGAALRNERTDVTGRLKVERAALLQEPGRHFVAIRLAVASKDVNTHSGGFHTGVTLLAGDRDSLETFLHWRRGLDVLLIFFIGAALSFALLHALLFLFMRNRTHREFAAMTAMLSLIPFSAFLATDARTADAFEAVFTVNKVAIVLTTVFGLRFYYAAFADETPR
jgi:hypothetical protein